MQLLQAIASFDKECPDEIDCKILKCVGGDALKYAEIDSGKKLKPVPYSLVNAVIHNDVVKVKKFVKNYYGHTGSKKKRSTQKPPPKMSTSMRQWFVGLKVTVLRTAQHL